MCNQHCTNLVFYMCVHAAVESKTNKVDFLGMSLDSSAAKAGQWILLALGIVFLLVIIVLAYKYRKAKKYKTSASMLELK